MKQVKRRRTKELNETKTSKRETNKSAMRVTSAGLIYLPLLADEADKERTKRRQKKQSETVKNIVCKTCPAYMDYAA